MSFRQSRSIITDWMAFVPTLTRNQVGVHMTSTVIFYLLRKKLISFLSSLNNKITYFKLRLSDGYGRWAYSVRDTASVSTNVTMSKFDIYMASSTSLYHVGFLDSVSELPGSEGKFYIRLSAYSLRAPYIYCQSLFARAAVLIQNVAFISSYPAANAVSPAPSIVMTPLPPISELVCDTLTSVDATLEYITVYGLLQSLIMRGLLWCPASINDKLWLSGHSIPCVVSPIL
jgi:hypothetical protein